MKGRSIKYKKVVYNEVTFIGIALGIFFWLFEASAHTFIFYNGNFADKLFAPDSHEAWMRSFVVSLFIAFGIYAQLLINRRRQAEQIARESDAKSKLILHTMPSGLFTVNLDRKITSWNAGSEEITKLKPDEVIGKDCLEALNCEECKKGCALFDSTIGKPIFGKECVVHVDGNNITLSKNADILRGLEGQILGGLESFIDITGRKQMDEEREKIIKELRDAVAKVKTLSGLIPICASCKKIRDDNGYWKQIETYIRDNSEADFTHGICPECEKRLYPELQDGDTSRDDMGQKIKT
jgi:PAS domain S-box-containing protein